MREKEKLIGDFLKEVLLNDTDFLTSGLRSHQENYELVQKICRIITVILLLICVAILIIKYL